MGLVSKIRNRLGRPGEHQGSSAGASSSLRTAPTYLRSSAGASPTEGSRLATLDSLQAVLKLGSGEISSGRYRSRLYRFLTDNVPLVGACVWTWSRLAAAPAVFKVARAADDRHRMAAQRSLNDLHRHIARDSSGGEIDMAVFLTDVLSCMFRDGLWGAFLAVHTDGSGVDGLVPVEAADIRIEEHPEGRRRILAGGSYEINLDRPDFFSLTLNGGRSNPLGRSILQSIPFVAYIEQQLVDDMRRAVHSSGYHRLHVKISPPERMTGEAENAYVERINQYFDSTVSMIRTCEVDDNPVTWDNVSIESIGADGARSATNRWFMNHRAMVEEICAGTQLAPFLLGYSYGSTQTWAAFKFDLVMRQVRSVQQEVAQMLAKVGDIHLALAGIEAECRLEFDNSFAYQAGFESEIKSRELDDILKLHQAGLLDDETARSRVRGLV
ncbi:MAG: hypothetical protein ABIE70_04430 [bacterium]